MLTRRLRNIYAAMSPRNFWKTNNGGNSKIPNQDTGTMWGMSTSPGRCKDAWEPVLDLALLNFSGSFSCFSCFSSTWWQFPTVPYDFNAQLYKSDREESGTVWNMNNVEKWWPACIKVYMIHMESIEPTARISRRPLRGQTSQQSETPYFHHLLCPQILEAV